MNDNNTDINGSAAARPVVRVAQDGSTPVRSLPAVDRAIRDLEALVMYLPALALLRDPATSRPWREPTMTAKRRAELDYAARIELDEADGQAPGEHPDACRADVLDTLSAVLARSVIFADHLSRAAWCPILRPPGADADPRPYLLQAAWLLPAACAGWENGTEIAWWAAGEAGDMLADVFHALSLLQAGQVLRIVCPWCGGRTEMAPLGGERTWRVHQLPGDEIAIVCESGTCNPPSKDVGTWWRGKPCWPLREWEWLAKRITKPTRKAST